MALIIEKSNGQFWNKENDCWTSARCAATEFEWFDKLPFEIDGLQLDGEYPQYAYYDDGNEPVASPIRIDGGAR